MRCSQGNKTRGRSVSIHLAAAGAIVVIAALTTGCGQPLEGGYANQGKLQLQFFSPAGASVTVKACTTRTHLVGTYPPDGERLERTPEQYCVFNLCPGTYEFKYVAAEGLEGVSVYGELEVHSPCHSYARKHMRRAFVPISLPSSAFKKANPAGNEIYPYRGERTRVAIDETDLMRLRQGDVIEKVFVVADMEKAYEVATKTRQDLIVLDRKLEYAELRFKNAYADFRLAADDPVARFFGADREFIQWEKERLELQQKIENARAKLKRAEALLKGDHVIIRKDMLVVATEEVVRPYKDVVDAADELGEVLLVMRLGGRHMHWGEPPPELASASGQ